jgi:hypothetical protein
MKIVNQTLYKEIDAAIIEAQELFSHTSPMMIEIARKNDFKYSSGDGLEVYKKLINNTTPISVYTYRPKWRWTKAIGYSDKLGIHINIYKLPKMSHVELISHICHDSCHMAGMSHGNNFKTKDKIKYSCPYFASEWVKNNYRINDTNTDKRIK